MQVWRGLHRLSITEGLRRIDLDREDEPSGTPDASAVLKMGQESAARGRYRCGWPSRCRRCASGRERTLPAD